MTNDDGARAALIRLVDAAEATYPYVTAEHLRRLAVRDPEWAPLTHQLARHIRSLVAVVALHCDNRQHLRRDGRVEPVRLYRLNRRHPLVAAVLDQPLTANSEQ